MQALHTDVEVRNWWIWAETKEKRRGPIEALVLLPLGWIHAGLGAVGTVGRPRAVSNRWLVGLTCLRVMDFRPPHMPAAEQSLA